MELLKWFQERLLAQCNPEWEHWPVIKITNLSYPGWIFSVELKGTAAEEAMIPHYERDLGDDDWIICQMVGTEFRCSGDPTKLVEMLERFRELVTPYSRTE
jgi:Immunity protein 53